MKMWTITLVAPKLVYETKYWIIFLFLRIDYVYFIGVSSDRKAIWIRSTPPSFNCHCHIIPRLPHGRLTCRLTRGAILEAGTKFLVVKRRVCNATNSATNVCIFTIACVRDSILVIRCHTCLLVIGKRCKRWTPVTLERRETVIPTGRFRRCWSWYGSGDIRICCYAILGTGTKSIERWFHNVTDSTADVFMIAIAGVGYSETVIQALACLLVITCLLQARLPGTLEAVGVPRGWLGNEGIKFVLTIDILFILCYFFERNVLRRGRVRVILSCGPNFTYQLWGPGAPMVSRQEICTHGREVVIHIGNRCITDLDQKFE